MDRFLYDSDLRHERLNSISPRIMQDIRKARLLLYSIWVFQNNQNQAKWQTS